MTARGIAGADAGPRPLRRPAGLLLAFTGAFAAWVLMRPGPRPLFAAVDTAALCLAPLLALTFCVTGMAWPWHCAPASGATGLARGFARRWARPLLALGLLAAAVEEFGTAYTTLVLRQEALWPYLLDAVTYVSFLLVLLSVPARPLPVAARTRVVLDGLTTMAAALTFSWYFLLGPLLLQDNMAPLDKAVAIVYPCGDLVLLACLLRLLAHAGADVPRPFAGLVASAGVIGIGAHSAVLYQALHGRVYASGGFEDVAIALSMLLIGLSARTLTPGRDASAGQAGGDSPGEVAARPLLWLSLLPYALVPAVGALLLYAWHWRDGGALGGGALGGGVGLGSVALVGLVLLRQVLALLENGRLYRKVEAQNRALSAANARLQAMATTDPLTEAPNHRAMVDALDHELGRAARHGRPCAVLFIDLDHFKALNDTHGHLAGDAALRDVAALARRAIREGDTVGRWGGEEFVVVLPEADEATAMGVAERVRAAVAGHDGAAARLTCSIGVAVYPAMGADRDGLVAAADRAMYAAKRLGRDQVRVATDPTVALPGAVADMAGSRAEAPLRVLPPNAAGADGADSDAPAAIAV